VTERKHDQREDKCGDQHDQNQQAADKPGCLPFLFRSRLGDPEEVDESIRNESEEAHSVCTLSGVKDAGSSLPVVFLKIK
jgi:hypothetical protein